MTRLAANKRQAQGAGERVVVLVGAQARRAAEGALRERSDVCLVRVGAPCEAVGEVMLPLGGEASAVAICVGGDALPSTEAEEFARAVREAAPGSRLVRVAADSEEGAQAVFDAVIAEAPQVEALLGAIGMEMGQPASSTGANDAPAPRQTPAAEASQVEAEAQLEATPDDEPSFSALADAGALDEGPVQAVLRGEPPLEACLERIRSATGDASTRFIAATAQAEVGPAEAWPVHRHGRRFGWLALPATEAETAQRCAAWLGAWLALDAQAAALREAAFVDELTGAWNRRYFNRFLAMAVDRARALRHHVTLMIFDIDDFKSYNDRYGHAAGDTVLKQTVRLLKSEIRPSDRVCRVGGDEFAVIFDEPEGPRSPGSAPPASIADIAQRFQRQICQHRFPELAQLAPGTLTISGGLATFPWDAGDPASLIKRADELALESKRQGKNLLTFGPGAEQVCRLAGLDDGAEESP